MPYISRFTRRGSARPPQAVQPPIVAHMDLRGLDLTSPYDSIQKNRSPFAQNFRMYAQEAGDRRVAISNRKGSGRYLDAVAEAQAGGNESTTGSTDALFSQTVWKAMRYTPTATGPLTRLDLRLKQNGASGPVVVELYTDDAGKPGKLLADSGIFNAAIHESPAYVDCHFVEAPKVTSGTNYWIVVHMQEDGTGQYAWRTNTDSSLALTSNTSGLAWESAGYSLAFKGYVSSSAQITGITRYTPISAANSTLIAVNGTMYKGNDVTGGVTSIATGLNPSATDYYFADMDGKKFWVNGLDNMKTYDGTTVETITHSQLPILKYIVAHKNRIFGVNAAEPNKLHYSEDPGNDDGAGNLWYKAWLSTSFRYSPVPKANDPITGIIPFQDNLYIYTRTNKNVLYGSDPGSFTERQATGKKGCVSMKALVADENYMYFVGTDGFYRSNGSSDEKISDNGTYGVQPEFDSISDLNKCVVVKWRGQIRFYYPGPGSAVNNKCLIWHTVFQEWFMDTNAYVSRAFALTDGDDPDALLEVNSNAPMVTYAEVSQSDYGKAIDFKYHCNYEAFGNPAQRKRLPRLLPLIEGEGGTYKVKVGIDKDRMDTPVWHDYLLETSGPKIGEFSVGDGTLLGIGTQFQPKRIQTSGYAYYWQLRLESKAIDNKVRFIGYVLSLRTKRM